MSAGPVRISLTDFLNSYFRLLDKVFSQVFMLLPGGGVVAELRLRPSGSIDERLAKIEAAKQNLLEGLAALDELKGEADANKKELQRALATIAQLEQKKSDTQKELASLRQVADLDAAALKKLFDVPTPGRVWRERFYGMVTGILTSLVASYLWEAFT